MQFNLIVPVQIERIESVDASLIEASIKQSVAQAIIEALGRTEDMGFNHPLEGKIAIRIDYEQVRIQ